MALYRWRMNSPEGCCHGLPWSPLLSSWCCPRRCASPLLRPLHALPIALAILADLLSPYLIILVSNAGRGVNKIINPILWFLPQLLVRQQWRCLLSTRGASSQVTKPQKVNELFDCNAGKKGSQWAQWTALMGKEMQCPILMQKCLVWARQSWVDVEERARVRGLCWSQQLERDPDVPPPASSPQSHRGPCAHQVFEKLELLIQIENVFFIPYVLWEAVQTHVQRGRKEPRISLSQRDTFSELC